MLFLEGYISSNQHTIFISKNMKYNYKHPDAIDHNHFFVGGVFQESQTDAYQLCVNKGFADVETVITESRWYHPLILGLTFLVYIPPRITYIWCK